MTIVRILSISYQIDKLLNIFIMKSKALTFIKPKIAIIASFIFLGFFSWMALGPKSTNNFGFLDIFKLKQNQNTVNAAAVNIATQKEIIKVVSEESQVIDVVKIASPAVVSIVASADMPVVERCYKDLGNVDPFFGDLGFRVPSYCQKGTEKQRIGAGSGFIVSSDGYILTNKHVVDNDKAEYTVILNNPGNIGEKVIAEVLALDPNNDIAILRIKKDNLPFIDFTDSANLQVGQTAITIGYSLGEFENTVSKGVVSGLLRSIVAGGGYGNTSEVLEGIIQTDAAINPGNSGGPLLDIAGNAIGMNVAMAQAQNIGFAIPSNDIKKVYEDVRKTGKIQRAYLGIRYMLIDEDLKKKNDLPYNYGALIVRGDVRTELAIVPGSPADKAGIVENDIILEADGIKIDSNNSLSKIIASRRSGDILKLKIYSKGKEKMVDVALAEKI